jgi:RNA:NAD 2'-phosphotransferase (TPT1/KptA family)
MTNPERFNFAEHPDGLMMERNEDVPKIFYHGTSLSNLASIFEKGIIGGVNITEERKNNRKTVFLTTSIESALGYAGRSRKQTGGRERVVLVVETKEVVPWKNVENCSIYKTEKVSPENIVRIIFPDSEDDYEKIN